MKIRVLISFLIAIILPTLLFGQESQDNEKFRRHRFSVGIGHAKIPSELEGEDNKKQVIIPSWGLAYVFGAAYEIEIGERWGVFPELIYQLKGGNTGAIILAFGASFKI